VAVPLVYDIKQGKHDMRRATWLNMGVEVEGWSCRENSCTGVVEIGGVLCSGDSSSGPDGSSSSPSPLHFFRLVWARDYHEVAASRRKRARAAGVAYIA
jgi:hypothetical protein